MSGGRPSLSSRCCHRDQASYLICSCTGSAFTPEPITRLPRGLLPHDFNLTAIRRDVGYLAPLAAAVCFCCVPCKPRGSHRTPPEEGPLPRRYVGVPWVWRIRTISRYPRHGVIRYARSPLATISEPRIAPRNGVRTFLDPPDLGGSRPSGSLKTSPASTRCLDRIGRVYKKTALPSRGSAFGIPEIREESFPRSGQEMRHDAGVRFFRTDAPT